MHKRPRNSFWRDPGIYPILDLEYCAKFGKDPSELAALWNRHRSYVPFYQLRAKKETIPNIIQLYRKLRLQFPEFPLILNDYADLALELNCFGLHLGKEDYENSDRFLRKRLSESGLFLGTSSHTLEELANLGEEFWDYTGFGPVFATSSKEGARPTLGSEILGETLKISRIPVTPIGGIDSSTLPAVLEKGNFIVAMISGASEPADFLRSIRLLEKVRNE
ncbi:thiamine phosphate synthase [Leptospira fluminis]|uniref:Thiamine phosphate synthase n=1 Tax=Leptospira fluminis TaxID=2484979 RepID=A0A4R9GN19_9LEPT|nr:thiamine phosphate synthase [Leptospira fluminis]TGK17577.1 thiamine phosphate synthase [Leptospira fluminis]